MKKIKYEIPSLNKFDTRKLEAVACSNGTGPKIGPSCATGDNDFDECTSGTMANTLCNTGTDAVPTCGVGSVVES